MRCPLRMRQMARIVESLTKRMSLPQTRSSRYCPRADISAKWYEVRTQVSNMNAMQSARHAIVALSAIGLLIPRAAIAAPQPSAAPRTSALPVVAPPQSSSVLDVALDNGGILHGQVVDPQGKPLAGVGVQLWRQQRSAGTATTNAGGYFELAGLQGGIYQVDAAQSHDTWRLWAPRTAPPAAQPAAMVVAGGNTARGQMGAGRYWIPALVVTGIVAAAIAIPIAVSNSNNNGS